MLAKNKTSMYNAYEMSDSMMKCKVEMTRKSKNDNKAFSATYVGDMVSKEQRLCFRYNESDTGAHCLVLYENDEVTIKRDGETRSELRLNYKHNSVAEIITPYGQMNMVVHTHSIERKANALRVYYSLCEGNEEIDRIDITWNLMKEGIS